MPHRLLNFLIGYLTGEKRAKKINQGEEKQQQQKDIIDNIQNRNEIEIDGGEEEYLPEDLVIESILTRLPARSLAKFTTVSKLWYNSILNDSRFSEIHYNQNKNRVFLVFNLLNNVLRGRSVMVYFFSFIKAKKQSYMRVKYLTGFNTMNTHEMVGFCNGLACTKVVGEYNDTHGSITVVNPIWGETLVLSYFPPTEGYIYLCHGFGFDALSQVYKAVIVFASEDNNELLCMVITLGTMSWRTIMASTFDISPPLHSPMLTSVPRMLWRPAMFCGGDLYWRTRNLVGDSDDVIEMLLSFDLHNEKIQFIRLPAECTLATATNERRYLLVDHLLEFKGYPCIARSERITRSSNNDHCGHRCSYQTGVCCCCCKVHMYILKDKDKQVWTREETFDIQIMDQEGVLPAPLCCYFDSSDAMPPTRILSFSDQVLLYWFNGERLVLYNFQEKYLKVVECFRSYPSIFQAKMNEDLERFIDDGDNIYCPSMDYQLHAQVENIISLETFIPKEAKTVKIDCADEVKRLIDNNPATGVLMTGIRKNTYYVFY